MVVACTYLQSSYNIYHSSHDCRRIRILKDPDVVIAACRKHNTLDTLGHCILILTCEPAAKSVPFRFRSFVSDENACHRRQTPSRSSSVAAARLSSTISAGSSSSSCTSLCCRRRLCTTTSWSRTQWTTEKMHLTCQTDSSLTIRSMTLTMTPMHRCQAQAGPGQ